MIKRLALCSLILSVMLALPANIGARIIRVDQRVNPSLSDGTSWPTAFSSLNTGLEVAVAGDEIWVAEGTYRTRLTLKNGVALYGGFAGGESVRSQRDWSSHPVILDGAIPPLFNRPSGIPWANPVVIVPADASSTTRLDGFTICNSTAGAIYCAGGAPVLANNTIIDNQTDSLFGGCGLLADASSVVVPSNAHGSFTNVAQRLLKAFRPELSIDCIPIYPTNTYTAEVHRLLQVAANICDAMTNRGEAYPYLPAVFRPVFAKTGTTIRISGYEEATNVAFLSHPWRDLSKAEDRDALGCDDLVFGIPFVIGTKKGHPNFNEFSLMTDICLVRQLEVTKPALNARPNQTNIFYLLGISNRVGVESWNAYSQAYPRNLELRVTNRLAMALTKPDGTVLYTNDWSAGTTTNMAAGQWAGGQYLLPLLTNSLFLTNSVCLSAPPFFQPATSDSVMLPANPADLLHSSNQMILTIQGRLTYLLIDESSQRVIDFVNLDNLSATLDVSRTLLGTISSLVDPIASQPWDPAHGLADQMSVSLGWATSPWYLYSPEATSGQDKNMAIDLFRYFVGLSPITYPDYTLAPLVGNNLSRLTPFNPARRTVWTTSLQANDPLVHYTLEDLVDSGFFNGWSIMVMKPPFAPLPPNNLGRLNDRYRPWGGHPYRDPRTDSTAWNSSFKDFMVGKADDWDFPGESIINLRWLDRIHRGTPWQTVYYGAGTADARLWGYWSGSGGSRHPTNDWLLAEWFVKDRLGLTNPLMPSTPIIINNTLCNNGSPKHNGAVVVYSGVSSQIANNIIAFNDSGIARYGDATSSLRNNCVFKNTDFDYAGLPGGTDDISLDPQFASPASGHYQLQATSPGIDAGDDNAVSDWMPINDPCRRQGMHIDIGAYELAPSSAPVLTWLHDSETPGMSLVRVTGYPGQRYVVQKSNDFTNWFNLETNVTLQGSFEFRDISWGQWDCQFYRAALVPE